MDFRPVNFDCNATTPLAPSVLAAMLPYLEDRFGNPSSRHEYGREARRAVDAARQSVAVAVGAHPTEIVFTSGGTEANNLALKGSAATLSKGRLAIGATEHPSVREPARQLARNGWQLSEISVDETGRLDFDRIDERLAERPSIVSLMAANNETGVLAPVAEVAPRFAQAGAIVHCDAVQLLGKAPVNFRELGVALLSVSAHKIGGPKGVGALVVDKRIELHPLMAGGGQEHGLRSGTENVAAIVGFGRACELIGDRLARAVAVERMRDELEGALRQVGAVVFGAGAARLGNTSFFAFPDIDGETLVGKLDRAGFAVASGSACSSADASSSPVLRAMGVEAELARGAVRVSLDPWATAAETKLLATKIGETVAALRHTASVLV